MEKINKESFKVDFIGIGAAKCATSWVFRCLLEHPEICGPYKKELNFFLTDPKRIRKDLFEHISFQQEFGMKSYEKFFAHCPKDSVKGEFSVAYLGDNGTAKKISGYFPDVKIIVCLRDPVKRAHSLYWFRREYTLREKNETFEKALERNPDAYIEEGLYYKHLRRYLSVFPKENMGVYFVDDLKKDPVAFMQKIYHFLNVDDSFIPPSGSARENSAKKTRNRTLKIVLENGVASASRFLRKIHLYFIIDWLRKTGLEDILIRIDRKMNVLPFEKPPISQETEKKLREIFKEDIESLEKMTGRDLSSWK